MTPHPKQEPLTAGERQYIEKLIDQIGRRRIRRGLCFANAQRLMMYDQEGKLCYWECLKPFEHAWVTINGKIVDVTAEALVRWFKRHKTEFGDVERKYLQERLGTFDYSQGVRIARIKMLRSHVDNFSYFDSILRAMRIHKKVA